MNSCDLIDFVRQSVFPFSSDIFVIRVHFFNNELTNVASMLWSENKSNNTRYAFGAKVQKCTIGKKKCFILTIYVLLSHCTYTGAYVSFLSNALLWNVASAKACGWHLGRDEKG